MKALLFCFVALFIAGQMHAQGRFFTKTGRITFYSSAPMEDIDASNKTAAVVLDAVSGALQLQVLMKGFEFKKALMQDHFNEDYVESDRFPNGVFTGSVVNNSSINYNRPGTYPATVRGDLTIHGVTRPVETAGTVTVGAAGLSAKTEFNILLSDFNIKRPSLVKSKVSNNIKISVECLLAPLGS